MNLRSRYHHAVSNQLIEANPIQAQIIESLAAISERLTASSSSWWTWLRSRTKRKRDTVQGVYCWGGVGVGKTLMMDMFYDTLATERKLRIHFHRFMQRVHLELARLQGQVDPLTVIAKDFAAQYDILCFDEFMVHDIADAMILAGLLTALFEQGMVLVATSNVKPAELYRNGLQRAKFLPAIACIEQHTDVIHCRIEKDYRLQECQQRGTYFTPITPGTDNAMRDFFLRLSNQSGLYNQSIHIQQRALPCLGVGSEVLWCDFAVLCGLGRSQRDYLEIADVYNTLLLSNVPAMTDKDNDKMRLFIFLIDVLYDAKVKLILQAEVPLTQLYPTGRLAMEFQRTQSRLIEMQSESYLHQQHTEPALNHNKIQ